MTVADNSTMTIPMPKDGITYTDIKSREDVKDYLFSGQMIDRTRDLYIKQGLTARQTIEAMSLSQWYEGNTSYFARAFSYYLPKGGVGRGGARPNAGRPLGSKQCTGCGELRENCQCTTRAGGGGPPYNILRVIVEPSSTKEGTYSAVVAIESNVGKYKVYEREVERYPTHADIQKTAYSGTKVPPERARAYFDSQLEQELDW